jgi:integrase
MHQFKRMLTELPANATKRFQGMTAPEAIKANKARAKPYPALEAKTINNGYLTKLHSILAWCVRNDVLPDNPVSGIKLDAVKAKEPPRVPFAPSDLGKIFALGRFKKPYGEEQWALLLALFTGARASELGQLKLDSVRHQRDVLVLVIEEETKNIGSQRVIPVHSTLIALGFQKYIDRLRAKGETHVFPKWHAKASAARERTKANSKSALHYSRYIPRRFNVTVLGSVGITDPRKRFHSFRHSFKTALKDAGVEKAMRDSLAGHSDPSVGGSYEHTDAIEQRKIAIEKLRFDGFTLGT